MNAVEVEEAVSELADQPFDAQEFPFAFLTAFGNKETTVKRLRSASSNSSDMPGGVLTEQGSPAFEAAVPILSQLLKAETADREVRSTAYQLKAARFPNYRDLTGFDFASSEGQRGARTPTSPLRVPGRRPQCRPARRSRARVIMLTSPCH
jgi:hypothetical protein